MTFSVKSSDSATARFGRLLVERRDQKGHTGIKFVGHEVIFITTQAGVDRALEQFCSFEEGRQLRILEFLEHS